jgi:hypothetical protein
MATETPEEKATRVQKEILGILEKNNMALIPTMQLVETPTPSPIIVP